MKSEERLIGYYKVCHPYYMDKPVLGYWTGEEWIIPEVEFDVIYEDNDLNWIGTELLFSSKSKVNTGEFSDGFQVNDLPF